MSDYRELLIGCGRRKQKRRWIGGQKSHWFNVTTLDIDPDIEPDVMHDLCDLPLPFEDDTFDEIHAYEVLEHTGRQGDYRFFFAQFSDFWRILKPSGVLLGTSPALHSPWLWGDPGHTRVICREVLTFLDQSCYESDVGKAAMTDYRNIYRADFELSSVRDTDDNFEYALKAVKPSRLARS